MINVIERAISRLCVLGKVQFNHALSADDVIPLLMDVIVQMKGNVSGVVHVIPTVQNVLMEFKKNN